MAKIMKVLNSSVVLAENENGKEVIILQKGIGYGHKAGEHVDLDDSARVFTQQPAELEKLAGLLKDLDPEYLEAVDLIMEYAQIMLGQKLNPRIYLGLTDHLAFAVERQKENLVLSNRLFWEVKSFYPREFKIGQYGLKVVKSLLKVELPEEEAANIALHVINAAQDQGMDVDAMRAAKLVKAIVQIITLQLPGKVDDGSLHYSRFISHIQFFVQRFLSGSMLSDENAKMFEAFSQDNPRAYQIAGKVRQYLEKDGGAQIPEEEIGYLTVHIARLMKMQAPL